MNRIFALLPLLLFCPPAVCAPIFAPGAVTEIRVELPRSVRMTAGGGRLSPVSTALVTIAVPADFDVAREWPVMFVSATSDPGYNSSRGLLDEYAASALAAGWVLVAADPAEKIPQELDTIALRYALNNAAFGVLEQQWPLAARSPLAFGGFSGGAKYSGWLAAAYRSQGRRIVGVFFAGISQDVMVAAARQFDVLDDDFKRLPIFLSAGDRDNVATPSDHRAVYTELGRAGFLRVKLEFFHGVHEPSVAALRQALEWFRETPTGPAGRG